MHQNHGLRALDMDEPGLSDQWQELAFLRDAWCMYQNHLLVPDTWQTDTARLAAEPRTAGEQREPRAQER